MWYIFQCHYIDEQNRLLLWNRVYLIFTIFFWENPGFGGSSHGGVCQTIHPRAVPMRLWEGRLFHWTAEDWCLTWMWVNRRGQGMSVAFHLPLSLVSDRMCPYLQIHHVNVTYCKTGISWHFLIVNFRLQVSIGKAWRSPSCSFHWRSFARTSQALRMCWNGRRETGSTRRPWWIQKMSLNYDLPRVHLGCEKLWECYVTPPPSGSFRPSVDVPE